MNLYVFNLGMSVDDAELYNLFAPYGRVIKAKVIQNKSTDRSQGFGFVEMGGVDGTNAMNELNGTLLNGRTLSVSEAKPLKS